MTAPAWRRSGCLRRFHPRENAIARLVCFPHAGGSASTFMALSAGLPDRFELLAVQYPGRQERRFDAPAAGLVALAEEAAGDLQPLDDRPLALYGHSMGALVAFETARRLDGWNPAVRPFASAAWPPSVDWHEPDLETWGDDAIITELRRLDGLPEPVLCDDDVLREVLRIVRADQPLIRQYRADADAVLAAPLTAMLGDTDPKNTIAQVRGWARHTSAEFAVEVLRGGHFYLHDPRAGTAQAIAGTLAEDLSVHTELS